MAIVWLGAQTFTCLSGDTKPTNVPVGTIARETDTDKIYIWDGSSYTQPPAVVATSNTDMPADTDINNYSSPSSATSSSDDFNPTESSKENGTGSGGLAGYSGLIVLNEITGLTIGDKITAIEVQAGSSTNCRTGLYDDSGGNPDNLLAQTGEFASNGSKQKNNLTAQYVLTQNKVFVGAIQESNKDWLGVSAGQRWAQANTYSNGLPSSVSDTPDSVEMLWAKVYYLEKLSAGLAVDDDTATFWTSTSEVNPNIYVDLGSELLITNYAIWLDTTVTTVTSIQVQTSNDAVTWTTEETLTVSELSDGAWNYKVLLASARYIRFRASDAGAVVMKINEIKVKTQTAEQALPKHGHP